MGAVSGTRRTMKELVDGTIRVQIDIDPLQRAEFLRLFPSIDMPVALAPLHAGFERGPKTEPKAAPPQRKGQTLSQYAAMLCQNSDFQAFMGEQLGAKIGEVGATDALRLACGIESRSLLDKPEYVDAIRTFHHIREQYHQWLQEER